MTVLAVVLALLPTSAWAATPADPGRPSDHGPAVKADRDGDKLFDDLEAVLEPLNPQDMVAVIVTLTGPATQSRVDRVRAEEGHFEVGHRFSIIQAFSATMRKSQVLAAARRSDVVHLEHDSEVRATNESAQASFGVTAAQLQVAGLTGAGLAAAVIDTGIDPNHQDLAGRVVAFKDYVRGKTTAYDDNGHGTHVSGTIAANVASPNSGVAPAANLVGVKVLDRRGSGSMANVTAGIEWVVTNRATYNIVTINLSLGTSGCSDGTDATSVAVNNASTAGIVVAVAAGNAGSGTCTVGSPGAAADAVTVGAMTDFQQGGFHQAYFSSRGPTVDGRIKPDVSAPGVNITSAKANTAAGYTTMSGTSMATPFVAGVALLMRQVGAAHGDVKTEIMSTAQDWGTTGADNDYGAGRLDAYAALAAAGAALTAPPVMPAHDVRTGTLSGTGYFVDYPLVVTDTSFPVAATLIHSSVSAATATNPDFDLYLLAPDGTELDRGYTTQRQEDVGVNPTTTGTYIVRVQSYNGSGPYLLDLSAGTAPAQPVASVSPASLSFGTVNVGTTSPSQNVTVTNTGTASLVISAIALTGANPGDFGFTSAALPITVEPAGNTVVPVTFAPTASGARAAALQLTHNATPSTTSVSLSGSGDTEGVPALTRFEESNPNFVFDSSWTAFAAEPVSGGAVRASSMSGSVASFAFTGTTVRWIGESGPTRAIATITIDDTSYGTVDTYASSWTYQRNLFTATGLTAGTHTITITYTGKNAAADATSYISIDAIDTEGVPG